MNRAIIFYILASLFLFSGCDLISYKAVEIQDEQTELSPIMQEALEKRYNKYRASVQKRCRERALKDAIAHIDTTIIDELNFQHLESSTFPRKPSRPKLPEGIVLNDSTDIKPVE